MRLFYKLLEAARPDWKAWVETVFLLMGVTFVGLDFAYQSRSLLVAGLVFFLPLLLISEDKSRREASPRWCAACWLS